MTREEALKIAREINDCPCITCGLAADAILRAVEPQEALLREAAEALEPFAKWLNVMNVLAKRDNQRGITRHGEWSDLDPVLGALGQLIVRGDFRRAASVLARIKERE